MNTALCQLLLEETYNRKTIRLKVMEDITGSNFGQKFTKAVMDVHDYLHKDYYQSKMDRIAAIQYMPAEKLVQETLAAVAISSEPQPIQAVAARLGNHLGYEDPFDAIRTAAELIGVICYSDLYDIVPAKNSETGSMMVSSNLVLDHSTVTAIDKTKYLPPMVTKPHHVDNINNIDTSHLTFRDSLLLGKEHHHTNPLALDAVNIANQVKLALDEDMLQFEEVPNKDLDTPDKINQFNKMAEDSLEVYNEILDLGNEFYLTWKFDFRGRMYSQGYHINIQSTGYKKSLINLAKKEVITT